MEIKHKTQKTMLDDTREPGPPEREVSGRGAGGWSRGPECQTMGFWDSDDG